MGFGNLGFGEIIFILLILLLVFGARRLPEIGQSLGKGIREFKKSMTEISGELNNSINQPQAPPPQQYAPPMQPYNPPQQQYVAAPPPPVAVPPATPAAPPTQAAAPTAPPPQSTTQQG